MFGIEDAGMTLKYSINSNEEKKIVL